MPQATFKNTWGQSNSRGQGIDQARTDLFWVEIGLPPAVGGSAAWEQSVKFAVSKFPFPARSREMVPVKYLNQTNYLIGAEIASPEVTMTVRYAFNQPTATVLEKWHWMTSHPGTGGVALTTQVKADGKFFWLVPTTRSNFAAISGTSVNDNSAFSVKIAYVLEGILVKGLKPTDADMETGTGLVNLELSLQIDRYYPSKPEDLQLPTLNF